MEKEILVSEQTAELHKELLEDVFRAIELGNAYSIQRFEADGEKVQPTHLFDTMRYKAALHLRALGYQLLDLPMNGLHVFNKGYNLKILKSAYDGGPPIAGRSKKRWLYYNHDFNAPKLFEDDMAAVIREIGAEERRELLVLYKTARDGNFVGISLVCVEEAPTQYGKPLVAWNATIPHPAVSANQVHEYGQSPTELENIDMPDTDADDLGIFKDGTN